MKSPCAQSSPSLLPDEVVMEILSRLSVKSLVRFRCISKSWKSLIADPSLVKLHLQRSPKYANVFLTSALNNGLACVLPCSVRSLMENPSSNVTEDGCYRLKRNYLVCGSVNGLVCLRGIFRGDECDDYEYWVRFWNPATRSRSGKSPCLHVASRLQCFGFGYDNSTDTYKVVAILYDDKTMENELRVHSKGDSCWRKIFSWTGFHFLWQIDGHFVSGSLNWLGVNKSGSSYEWGTVTVNQLVIFSFDLGKETYKQLLMPDGLDQVPQEEPKLAVLRDCLCLFHDYKRTHFVVWQMKEFGVEKCWTQLVNVSYQHLQIESSAVYQLKPLYIFENGDVLISSNGDWEAIVYNWIDNRVERIEIPNNQSW